MKIRLIVLFILAIFMSSCNTHKSGKSIDEYFNSLDKISDNQIHIKYAKGFTIERKKGISKLTINNPSHAEEVVAVFYLVNEENIETKFAEDNRIIKLPLHKIAAFSGTQLNSLIKLGQLNKIVGVSEARYIRSAEIKERVKSGDITELAGNGEFYVETALSLNPDLIFYSPYKINESHPLAKTNILMVPYIDFMETSPLGRAEWIKFNSLFFGEEGLADSLFNNIEKEYRAYVELAAKATFRPSVFSDKFFAGQWYVPGGRSYIAKLFNDAGADYLWKNDTGIASFPLDYEVVFEQAQHADYWRIVGSYNDEASYDFIKSQNELYTHFDAFKKKKIIWCDAKSTSYFENGPLEPHIFLADLIYCFHPELLPDYKPKYYKVLE